MKSSAEMAFIAERAQLKNVKSPLMFGLAAGPYEALVKVELMPQHRYVAKCLEYRQTCDALEAGLQLNMN